MRSINPRPFRHPGLAILAVLAMALGIGSFSASLVLARALLVDLPVDEPERVVEVARTVPRWPDRHLPVARSTLREIREGVGGLRSVGGFRLFSAHLTAEGLTPVRVRAAEVTPGVFAALGVQPLLGRWLPSDGDPEGAERTVVLGHRIWRERFGEDRSVLGGRIRVNEQVATVVGVMPPDFSFPRLEELWISFPPAPEAGADPGFLNAVGRLADGASLESLRAELAGLAAGRTDVGASGNPIGLTARRWVEMLREEDATARAVAAMLALFGLVLAVACANVALLFLVRALRAERTTATRLALGAPRSTLVLERLVETLALAIVGGALGLTVTVVWTSVMRRVAVGQFDYGVTFAVDWPVACGTAAGVVAAALAAGLLPALRGTDLDIASALRRGTGGSSVRLGVMAKLLVVAEVAFSCVVLVSIGHSVRGLTVTLGSTLTDFPIPSERVLVARYELLEARHPDPAARTELARRVVETLRSHPGVEGVAVADALAGVAPALGARRRAFEVAESRQIDDEELPGTRVLAVSPEFFSLLGADPLRGRSITWHDAGSTEPVVLVNESFARRFLGDGDVLGRRVRIDGGEWRRVVGVVPDVAMERPDGSAHGLYIPFVGVPAPSWILVRAADPLSIVPVVRDAVWSEDPRIPLYDAGTLEGTVMTRAAPAMLLVTTMTFFGLAALFITLVGLHGLLAFSMGGRRREIAIRSALGAARPSVVWHLLRGTGGRVAVGLGVGVVLAWWLSPHLGEGLLGADPRDPLFYVVVPAVLSGGALAAATVPLVRALRTEVMEALRVE